MWNLNSLAKNLQEQVTKVARDTGIDEHLVSIWFIDGPTFLQHTAASTSNIEC